MFQRDTARKNRFQQGSMNLAGNQVTERVTEPAIVKGLVTCLGKVMVHLMVEK